MRVLYYTCFMDPWVRVAKKLNEEHGWEPICWVGYYEDDNSRNLISEVFPSCIYQRHYHAWKGIYPQQIEDKYAESYINIDFLRDYSVFELQAIKMMDRIDPDRHSFNFMERQRHYRKMLKYYTACLLNLKIDLVVCNYMPHRVSDYVIYLLCNFLKIEFRAFMLITFSGSLIVVDNVANINRQFDKYKENLIKHSKEDLKNLLPKAYINKYLTLKGNYTQAEPYYMKSHFNQNKKSNSFLGLFIKLLKYIFNNTHIYFSKRLFAFKGFETSYYKVKNRSIEQSNSSIFHVALTKLKGNKYNRKLKKHYHTKLSAPDLYSNYILFPLHYQPELTSSPLGDFFVDQLLCVEVLLKNLPENYYIYVKEHRAQFYSHLIGYTSRIKELYDDLLKYKRVKLISEEYNQFELIEHAKAIATLTGTVGWEAILKAKPVIMFGVNWYENFEEGVLKITNEKSAKQILSFINNYKYSEDAIFAYMYEIYKKSFKAYMHKEVKNIVDVSEDECVDNLIIHLLNSVQKN